MNWFIFSLMSIAALASAELIQQRILNSRKGLNERASAVFTFAAQSFMALPVLLLSPLRTELLEGFTAGVVVRILIVTFISAVAAFFYFRSFQVKNISFSAIFISGSVIVSTILGIIFFDESASPLKFLGIAAVLAAIILVNYKNASIEKNHFFGLVAALCFGITFTLDKSIVSHVHPLAYITWAFFLVGLWGFVFTPKSVIQSVRENKLSAFLPILVSAFGYFLYNLLTFLAYTHAGEVGRVDAINNSYIFLLVLFEFVILRQRQSVLRKVSAIGLAALGVLLLGL